MTVNHVIRDIFSTPDYCIAQAGEGPCVQVNYKAIANSFYRAIDDCWNAEYMNISIPRIESGLGGGDWTSIVDIIYDVTPTEFTTTIWSLNENYK